MTQKQERLLAARLEKRDWITATPIAQETALYVNQTEESIVKIRICLICYNIDNIKHERSDLIMKCKI